MCQDGFQLGGCGPLGRQLGERRCCGTAPPFPGPLHDNEEDRYEGPGENDRGDHPPEDGSAE
jgi:hypothetical protein